MSVAYNLIPHLPVKLLSAQTTDEQEASVLFKGQTARVTVAVQCAGTIDAGVVTIEEAYTGEDTAGYTGTWSLITTVDLTTLTGGKQAIVHVAGSVWALRTRISTGVTGSGGSVTTWAWGN